MKSFRFVFPVVLLVAGLSLAPAAFGEDYDDYGYDDVGRYVPYSMEGLEELAAPIALYPDPLLAQILPASTFGDQIDEAERYVARYGATADIDDQDWDVSVRAIAHYPNILAMMDRKPQWAAALGQAYINQPDDLMIAIQNLRARALAEGNLVSTPQQQVITEDDDIRIIPAQPQFIYVPVYNPQVVYVESPVYGAPFITFGVGYSIGVWLNRDCDWRSHRVYYHGWRDNRGWTAYSRPYVRITNVYVNNRYETIHVDRRVMQRDTTVYYRTIRNNGPVRHEYGRPAAPPPWRAPERERRGEVSHRTPVRPAPPAVGRQPASPAPTRPPSPTVSAPPRPNGTPAPVRPSASPEYRRPVPPSGFGGYGTRRDADVSRERGKASRESAVKPVPSTSPPKVRSTPQPIAPQPQSGRTAPQGGKRDEQERGPGQRERGGR